MIKKSVFLSFVFAVALIFCPVYEAGAVSKPMIQTANQSVSTVCAEEDNVNIPLSGKISSFVIEATHPAYTIATDNCTANFANCNMSAGQSYSFSPGVFKLFDDGTTVVEAVRESSWWLPNGMAFSVDNGTPVSDIHYIRMYRKIADANEWPQYLVLYMDGNLRLIPQPPTGVSSVCFGSSVVVGPTVSSSRPFAEIASATYNSLSDTIDVHYKSGGTATISMLEISRAASRVQVSVNYPTDVLPFAVFRSMFVSTGNSDVENVLWENVFGASRSDGIMQFSSGPGTEWFFNRSTVSQHNTSGPDIRLKEFSGISQSCNAVLSNDLFIHAPIIAFGDNFYWADFSYVPNTLDFALTNADVITDIGTFAGCVPAALSSGFQLHMPAILYDDVSYNADFQYTEGVIFTLTGAGQN